MADQTKPAPKVRWEQGPELSFLLYMPALVWQVCFFYLPLISLLWSSLASNGALSLSFSNYAQLVNWLSIRILIRSLALALVITSACLVLGYLMGFFLCFFLQRLRRLWLFLVILPFWTNFLVQVYSWFFILGENGLLDSVLRFFGFAPSGWHLFNTTTAVYIVAIYCYLPYMVIAIHNVMEKFDKSLMEAAMDLGASYPQAFMSVVLPSTLRGAKIGVLLVMIPVFGEFAIPILVGGDKYLYVGSVVKHYFLVTRDQTLGSAYMILGVIVLAVVAFAYCKLLDFVIGGRRLWRRA